MQWILLNVSHVMSAIGVIDMKQSPKQSQWRLCSAEGRHIMKKQVSKYIECQMGINTVLKSKAG